MASSGPDVSLVLGSGGARGLAHIGAIRCLEEHGFEISYISGSSIGALIGGIYAAGKLDAYADWVSNLSRRDVFGLLNWSFSNGAIFSSERVISTLKDMVGDRDIEDLAIGFTAVATEINEQREIWLNRGRLFAAIQASIAMPLIFAPVERDNLLLVDGGLINPVPIAPTLNAGSSLTIAINLDGPVERRPESSERHRHDEREPLNVLELALRSIETMQRTIANVKLAIYRPDLTIQMPANLCTFLEFHRARELIDFGYRRTKDVLRSSDLIA